MCAAAFVTCSAAGMALGPLLAVPMSRVPTIHFGPFTFNAITAGAYVMSLIWLVFLAVTIFFFTEPPVRYTRQCILISTVTPSRVGFCCLCGQTRLATVWT